LAPLVARQRDAGQRASKKYDLSGFFIAKVPSAAVGVAGGTFSARHCNGMMRVLGAVRKIGR